MKFKVPRSPQQSTIRRSHASLEAVRSRTAVYSRDSQMREVQAALRMIVESDLKDQNKEIWKRFFWMWSMGEETKQMGLYIKLVGGCVL